MSSIGNNVLTNGKFASPNIGANTISRMYFGGSITGWDCEKVLLIALCSGVLKNLGYKIAPTSSNQFVFITTTKNISQTFNITQTGIYYFSIDYCKSTLYNCNKFVISIDGVILASTPSSYGLNWTTLYAQVLLTTGTKVIKIEGTTNEGQGAFTNCVLYYAGGGEIVSPLPDPLGNKFNRTTIYGGFSVQDRYSKYEKNGNFSGNVVDSGNSIFYGDLSVKGKATFSGNVILPNYYNKSEVDTSFNNYYTKSPKVK